jgi:hypothetical protein
MPMAKQKQLTVPTAAEARAMLLAGKKLKEVLWFLPSDYDATETYVDEARDMGYLDDILKCSLGHLTYKQLGPDTPEQALVDAWLAANDEEEKERAEYLARKAAKAAAE